MRIRSACVLLLISIAGMGEAAAQQNGQYILGTNGLNAGIQPSPGLSYGNEGTVYFASRANGDGGQAIPTAGSFDLNIGQKLFTYTSKFKFLGGTFGGMFDLPIANSSVTAAQPCLSGGAGLSDIYVQPFTLGFSVYEFHGKKRCTNITPGQDVNFEWGLAHTLPAGKNFLQAGVAGYGQWQTTASEGSLPTVVKNSRYGVAEIGPQAAFIVPKWNSNLFFRYEPEFGASARIDGNHHHLWWSHQFSSDQMICLPATNPAIVNLLAIPPDSQLLWGRPRRLSGPSAMHGRRPVQPDRGD